MPAAAGKRMLAGCLLAALGVVAATRPARATPADTLALLQRGQVVTVAAICDLPSQPWSYRGRFTPRTLPRIRGTSAVDSAWVAALLATLREPGSPDSLPTMGARCESADPPLYVVRVVVPPGAPDLLLDPTRGRAVAYRRNVLSGTWTISRPDSVRALLRRRLPADLAPSSAPMPGTSAPASESVYVEELPVVLQRVKPIYPMAAIQARIEGEVKIQALIGNDGAVRDAVVLHGIPGLDDAALESVWQWKFQPARAHGQPVAVWVSIPVRFRLR